MDAPEVIEVVQESAAAEVASATVQAIGTSEAMIESAVVEAAAASAEAHEEILTEVESCVEEQTDIRAMLVTLQSTVTELRESNLSLREQAIRTQESITALAATLSTASPLSTLPISTPEVLTVEVPEESAVVPEVPATPAARKHPRKI